MRLAALLLALALLALAVPAVSHPAPAGCGASIPDAGDEDCDGARTDGSGPPDNCPTVKNADQVNTDSGYTPSSPAAADGSTAAMAYGDGAGDACDDDDDADGVPDARPDNCPRVRNPDQTDAATLCPPQDGDGDGTHDDADNCRTIANPDQADLDQDRLGDACEYDDDGDNVPDGRDNCPRAPNSEQTDKDGDGIGTACDAAEIPQPAPASFTPDRTAPVVRLWSRARRGLGDARGGLATRVSCSEACDIRARLTAGRIRVATADARLHGQGRTWLFFRWRRGGISRSLHRRVTIHVTATDAAANVARARRAFRLGR